MSTKTRRTTTRRTTSSTRAPRAPHTFLTDRNMREAWMVIRLDDYRKDPEQRGQFYANAQDPRGGLWPTKAKALHAAEWAMRQSWGGQMYGVLKLSVIVEHAVPPIKQTTL